MTLRTAPGRETPTSKSLCPSWCGAQDDTNHWDYPGKLWQTSHEKRFDPFVVYIPHELHDDGTVWIGRAEVHTDETDHVTFYASEALSLAGQLQAAARFAKDLDESVADQAAAGRITTV